MANATVHAGGIATLQPDNKTYTFTLPSDLNPATDLIIVQYAVAGPGSFDPITGGSGNTWTTLTTYGYGSANASITGGVSWRRAAVGDVSATLTIVSSFTPGPNNGVSWTVVRTANLSSPIENFNTGSPLSMSSTSFVASTNPGLTVNANDLVLDLWFWRVGTVTWPATVAWSGAYTAGGNVSMACSSEVQASPGAPPRGTATETGGGSGGGVCTRIYIIVANPPLADTIVSPANGAYQDVVATPPTVSWNYNPSPGDDVQNAYAFRRKTSGGSYSYWSASGSSWSGTIVWNPSVLTALTFPSGAWTNGNIYNYSVASQETQQSLQGPFGTDLTLVSQVIPTLSGIAPTGTILNAQPTVSWTDTLAPGAVQTGWRVKIFTAAQYSAGGFDPNTSAATIDSGSQSGTATSYVVPTPLANAITYRTYVQITQSGNQNSAWTFAGFAISFDTPATPSVTATPYTDPVTGAPAVSLLVRGFDNLMTQNQASMEIDATGWTAGPNTTLGVQSGHIEDGNQALQMIATASGAVSATQAGGSFPVNALSQYTARADFYPETTARTATVKVTWKTVSGAIISASSGSAAEVGATFTTVSVTDIAPAGATQADVSISVAGCASSEKHDVDNVGLFPGPSTLWWRGGLNGLTMLELQYSDDGITWANVRGASAILMVFPDQTVALIDYEAPLNSARQYRAQITAAPGGLVTASNWSTVVFGTPPATIMWWLKDPLNSASALLFNSRETLQLQQREKATAHELLGRSRAVVTTDGLIGVEGPLQIGVLGAAKLATLRTLLRATTTLLVQSPFGDQWYVHFGVSTIGSAYRQWATQQDTLANPYTIIVAPFIEVDRP